MEKDLKKIDYETLSDILQKYLDEGKTEQALEYCEKVAQTGNPYGYEFMGFIYEEGHGCVRINYRKALSCYEKADALGIDMTEDIVRVRQNIYKMQQCVCEYCDDT